jgi:hypothetical protein
VVGLAALLATCLLGPLGQPAQAQPATLVSGVVRTPDGQPAAGAAVMVTAFPQADTSEMLAEVLLGQTVTDAQGYFALDVEPPVGARFRGPKSSLALVFHITFTDGTGFWRGVPALAPSSTRGHWAWLDIDATPERQARRAAAVPLILGAPASRPARAGIASRDDTNPDAPLGNPTPRALPACTEGLPNWHKTTDWSRRQIPVQRVRTRTRSMVSYEWSTTFNTMMDIAVTGSRGDFSAGLSYSRDNTASAGMSPSSLGNTSQLYTQEWQYEKWELYCMTYPGVMKPQGAYQWRPAFWTLGNTKRFVGEPSWACTQDHKIVIASPSWVARATTVKYAGWFSIGGASLASQQTNSSASKLTYSPYNASQARLCGSDAVPIYASQVVEIPW